MTDELRAREAFERLASLCNRDIEGQFEELTGTTFDAILAATAEPAPDVEALDVDRLTRAFVAHRDTSNAGGQGCDYHCAAEIASAYAALHPADPSRTPEVETWLAIRAALHEAANDKCRDGRFDHCYDQFHSPPVQLAEWWPPADPSRREP